MVKKLMHRSKPTVRGTGSGPGLVITPVGPLAALLVIATLAGCSDKLSKPVSETRQLLGTTCTVTLYDRAPRGIFEKVFARIDEIERRMTLNGTGSEVIAVNEAAGRAPAAVSPDTFSVISAGLEYSRLSQGAFDITIGPLVKSWGIGSDSARVPPEHEIREKLALIDYTKVRTDERSGTVYLEEPGMMLDLGAIAKGYAADETVRILTENGVKSAIIDLGGNIMLVGKKSDGTDWRIGVQDPDGMRGSYIGVIESGPGAVVTSGVYERFFVRDGVRFHHILDTETGYPVDNGLTSVTIVTPRSTDADGLSTSVFSLGLEKGIELIEHLPGVEAIFLTWDKQIWITSGLTGSFKTLDPAYTIREAAAASN
jgi:thiamine biosynthesis lipoprotein